MTSNAGAQSIVNPKHLGFISVSDEKKEHESMKNSVMDEVKKVFKPEFINRIDEIIVFRALNTDDMKKIASIQTDILKKRCVDSFDITLKLTSTAQNALVSSSFDSVYGARPLKRAVQTLLEDPLSEKILSGEIKRGDTVKVGHKKGKFVFSSEK